MSPILTKSEFLDLSLAGKLGNIVPSWPNESAARADHYQGSVMIRSRIPNSPHMTPDVPMDDVESTILRLIARGANRSDLYLTHMTKGVGRRINGELWQSPSGLYLNYSTVQSHLRDSLARGGRHVERSAAMAVLRWAGNEDDVEDLMRLLDEYPDHCIEFTAYDREMGMIPGRFIIVWELRLF